MAAKQSRYLGVQPFKTSDRHIFFGRDEDIENLHDTILLEKLIVLFGKSGYGKSSLLNAGIVPRLTAADQPPNERFRPIEVRFTSYVEGQSLEPIETMRRLVRDVLSSAVFDEKSSEKGAEASDFLKNLDLADSLWGQFKQRQGIENGQFVLIFDQFEEFFSYPPEQQAVFRRQLSELLYTDIPQAARARLGELSDAERRYLATPMQVKAVFAIREDRMSFLDSMKDALPAILHKRYKLNPLSIEQAKQAITQPAVMAGDFLSEKFEYTEGGLAAIIKALTAPPQPSPKEREQATAQIPTLLGKAGEGLGVEAFQLQIVCEYIESLVKEGKVPDLDGDGLPDITEAQLPHMAQLYAEYYYRKLNELDPSVKNAAQIALEDGLLTEDPATGEGRRMSVDSRALIAQFRYMGLTDAVLLALEKTYLIRREVNTVRGFSFEISHDTLVAPVQKAKKDRKHIQEKAQAAEKEAEQSEQLAAAKRQTDIEKQKRRKSNLALTAAVIGLAFAYWQYRVAENAKKIAENATKAAKTALVNAQEEKTKATKSDSLARIARDSALMQKTVAERSDSIAQTATKAAQTQLLNANAALAKVKIAEADKYIQSAKRLKDLDPVLTKQILEAAQRLLSEAEKLDKSNKEIARKQLEINALK